MKVIGWLAGVATLLAALFYMALSLNRWEWNRALFFGLIVVLAEIGLATGLILRKVSEVQRSGTGAESEVLQILRKNRPEPPERFAWLQPDRTNVFITFLVGGGVIVSGVAWLLDRVASRTTTPAGEEQLATRLGAISYPEGGLLVDDVTALGQELPGADDDALRALLRRPNHRS